MLIPDLQIPFEHQKSLNFCWDLQKEYGIPKENIYNLGDETDQYFGSLYDKDPEAEHTANSELKEARKKLIEWYQVFPLMKLCISNHGQRYWRKALAAGIPSQLLRRYENVIRAPKQWVWQKHWRVDAKFPFLIEHGDDWGGQHPHINASLHNGMSTAMGHHHSLVEVKYIKTNGLNIWAACGGSLINFERYAFNYARSYKLKPQTGALIVLDDGRRCDYRPLD